MAETETTDKFELNLMEGEEVNPLSAKIWQDIQVAVHELRSDLDQEFDTCRDATTIVAFLNEHFPITPDTWDTKVSIQVPGLLRSLRPTEPPKTEEPPVEPTE